MAHGAERRALIVIDYWLFVIGYREKQFLELEWISPGEMVFRISQGKQDCLDFIGEARSAKRIVYGA